MKLIKKLISSVVCVAILFSIATISVHAETIPYSYLVKVGFPATYLDSLSEDMILRIYETVADKDVYAIETKTMYLPETNCSISTYGSISEYSLHLDILSAEICQKGTTTITSVMVAASWDWGYSKPFVRKTDALTINWDSSIFSFSENSFLLQEKFKNYNSDGSQTDWKVLQEYSRPEEHSQGGVGFTTQLSKFNDFVGGNVLFLVEPKIRMRVKSTNEQGSSTNFNINYIHDRSITGLSYSFPIAGGNIGIQPSRNSYDKAADSSTFRYVAL